MIAASGVGAAAGTAANSVRLASQTAPPDVIVLVVAAHTDVEAAPPDVNVRVVAAQTEVAGAPPELRVRVAADHTMDPEVRVRVVPAQTEFATARPEVSNRLDTAQISVFPVLVSFRPLPAV